MLINNYQAPVWLPAPGNAEWRRPYCGVPSQRWLTRSLSAWPWCPAFVWYFSCWWDNILSTSHCSRTKYFLASDLCESDGCHAETKIREIINHFCWHLIQLCWIILNNVMVKFIEAHIVTNFGCIQSILQVELSTYLLLQSRELM